MKLILSLFFFVSIAAAQPYKFIFHRFPDNFKDGDSLVITRNKSERTVDLNWAWFNSVITTQDVKLPGTPQPRKSMQQSSHQSAQKVGFRPYKFDSDTTVIRLVTAQDFFHYERECWNDSTLTSALWEWDPIESKKSGKDVAKRVRVDYTHREPTFQGFIQWLRRQR